MTDIRQLFANPRKRVKLDGEQSVATQEAQQPSAPTHTTVLSPQVEDDDYLPDDVTAEDTEESDSMSLPMVS